MPLCVWECARRKGGGLCGEKKTSFVTVERLVFSFCTSPTHTHTLPPHGRRGRRLPRPHPRRRLAGGRRGGGGGWLAWHTVGRVSCSRPERGGGGQSARRCGGERVRVREYVVGGEVGREGDGGVARRQDASVQNHTHTLPFHRPFTTAPSPAATCCRWTKSSTRGRRPSSGEFGRERGG